MNSTHRQIQKLKVDDLQDAMRLVWEVFLEFEAPDYSQEGIAEFQRYIQVASISEMLENGKMTLWGCYTKNALIGVIATAPSNHISLLFVAKEHHRQGVARSLYHVALDACRVAGTDSFMTVNSSPYAIEAYHRLGFVDTNTEQTVNGLRFTPMQHHFNKI